VKHFFLPIAQMFNFSGRTTRKGYFPYAITQTLFVALATCLAIVVYVVLPGINVDGLRTLDWALDPGDFFVVMFVAITLSQFPMIALTVRRLRDANAPKLSLLWLFLPYFGPVVLFGMAFMPTYEDRVVGYDENGHEVWHSHTLAQRRKTGLLIAGALAAAGVTQMHDYATTATAMTLQGGAKVKTNPKMRVLNDQGGINKNNTIFSGNKAHTRKDGTFVKQGHNKRTW
jgi:uncharacterized membrane protein YhaH (DUF805 family)